MKWRDWRPTSCLSAAALLWCVAAGVLLYFLPLGSSAGVSSTGEQIAGGPERLFTLSLSSLWPLILPALLCGAASWSAARHHRWVLIAATVLLSLFAILGGFSIGLAYVPAVLLLIVSVLASSAVRQSSDGDGSVVGKG